MNMQYCKWMQGVSVIFCAIAIAVGGLHNPMMGFPLAIMVMIALEVVVPKVDFTNRQALRAAYGSVLKGGVRKGIFTKELFCLAIFSAFVWNTLLGREMFSHIYAVLSVALLISCVASEIEAYAMRKVISEEVMGS